MVTEETWQAFRQHFVDLFFPIRCAGCGRWDTNLCSRCWLLCDNDCELSAVDDAAGVPLFPLWSLGKYGGNLRNVILAAKHQPGRKLADFLFLAGANLGNSCALSLETSKPSVYTQKVWVIPAPSSHRRRWEDAEVTKYLAAGVARGVSESLGVEACVKEAVGLKRGRGSQSNRTRQNRLQGRHDALYTKIPAPPRTPIILVDDVYTTGATVREMATCLKENVQAIIVLAKA